MPLYVMLQAVIEFRLGYPNMKWRNVYKVSVTLCLNTVTSLLVAPELLHHCGGI